MQGEPVRPPSHDARRSGRSGNGERTSTATSVRSLTEDLRRCLSSADMLGLDRVAIDIDAALTRLTGCEQA